MYELLFTSIVHKQQAKIPKKELDKIKKLLGFGSKSKAR